ncbi:hypothetical protein CAPTEDRAFT_204202 [Capitella teleta]|uniref:Tetraspanin n=1 Tax=Capitella teleta TaxID=283909 RepID=R7UID8_CAPTE|nr:hypothetical protein CAPTEDRAFT_204202 [Capitella teleta]|eukprot:ELU06329.1 hypothetical protein CAPTEDRAFT_204202 [Capitella teleta]
MSRSGSAARLNEDGEVHSPNYALKKKLSTVNAIFAILFLLATIILIIIWLWEEFSMNDMYIVESFLGYPKFQQARFVLLTAHGVALLLICLLQFCLEVESNGKESPTTAKKILWSLSAAILILTDISAATLALAFKDNDLGNLQATMQSKIQLDFMNTSDVFSDVGRTFNSLQSGLQCCGVEGSRDYTNTLFVNRTGLPFPYSCCVLKSGKTGSVIWEDNVLDWAECQQENDDYFHSRGCFSDLSHLVSDMCTEIAIIGFTMSVIVLMMCCARLLVEVHFEKQNEMYLAYLTMKHVSLEVKKIEAVCTANQRSKNEVISEINQGSKNEVICSNSHMAIFTCEGRKNGTMTVDDANNYAINVNVQLFNVTNLLDMFEERLLTACTFPIQCLLFKMIDHPEETPKIVRL